MHVEVDGMDIDVFTFSVDIYKNISSANVFVQAKVKDTFINQMKVQVSKNRFTIFLGKGTEIYRQVSVLSPCITFIPTSFHCFSGSQSKLCQKTQDEDISVSSVYTCRHNNTSYESSFRLQISDVNEIKQQPLNECKKNMINLTVLPETSYRIHCSSCKEALFHDCLVFDSVDEYHENILELSENWFCHDHGDHRTLKAKLLALCINETSYFLPHSLVSSLNIEHDFQLGLYKCSTCSSVLSVVPSHSESLHNVGFFKDKIIFEKTEELSHSIFITENNIIDILLNLIQKNLQSAPFCKLYLETKISNEEKPCLLLWVTPQSISRYVLEQKIEDLSQEEILKTQEFLKVLYCNAPTSSISRSWRHDFNVDFHRISDSMMRTMTKFLMDSSRTVSCVDSENNDFKFGYLPITIV